MAIIGINTGSGLNTYTPGGGIGKERVNTTSGNADFGGKGISKVGNSTITEKAPLENQVAVSPDGDTVQISPKATAKFEAAIKEGQNKEEASETEIKGTGNKDEAYKSELKAENDRKEARMKLEKRTKILKELAEINQKKEIKADEKQNISFTGKSDSDITRLYLEGEITKSDYDSEMSSREKLRAQVTKKDNDFMHKAFEGDKIEKRFIRFSKELKAAFSEDASKTFDAVTRLNAIESAEGTKKAENEKKTETRTEVKFSYK